MKTVRIEIHTNWPDFLIENNFRKIKNKKRFFIYLMFDLDPKLDFFSTCLLKFLFNKSIKTNNYTNAMS